MRSWRLRPLRRRRARTPQRNPSPCGATGPPLTTDVVQNVLVELFPLWADEFERKIVVPVGPAACDSLQDMEIEQALASDEFAFYMGSSIDLQVLSVMTHLAKKLRSLRSGSSVRVHSS